MEDGAPPFTLDDLTAVARSVIGKRSIVLREHMTAKDVPGWDSLNHTLIAIEISALRGVEISARLLTRARNFGELLAMVNAARDD